MKKLSKLILPAIIIAIIITVYFTFFGGNTEIGDLSKFGSGSEVNQKINLAVVKSKNFMRDENGNITSFYSMDKNKTEVLVTSHEPIPPEIVNAEVIELIGHLHENRFTASKITVIK